MKDITKAIENLHEHLLTEEIVNAAVEEGNVQLLDYLPEKWLTPELIFNVVSSKNDDKYYLRSFDLGRIPLGARTKEVCLIAVKSDLGNFEHTPSEHRGTEMLKILVKSAQDALHLFPLIPEYAWSMEIVNKGIDSVISSCYRSNYTPRSHRYTGQTYNSSQAVELIQVFLEFIPKRLKTIKLYLGLFEQKSLSVNDIALLTPEKYKQHDYYLKLAQIDLNMVPESRYSYEHFMLALGPDSKMNVHNFKEKSKQRERLFELMDEKMADLIIERTPGFFSELPKKFRTTKRLILALKNNNGYSHRFRFISEDDRNLLTPTVCRLFIEKGLELPSYTPKAIWDNEFVNHCIQHGSPCNWLKRMPAELFNQGLADYLIGYSGHYISEVPQKFITYDLAVKVHNEYLEKHSLSQIEEYFPQKYYQGFTQETGLPEEFFGREITLGDLREDRRSYTYCKLGNSYLGIYCTGRWQNETYRIVLTRRTSGSIYPQRIFDKVVQTFHVTWLEKLIADNDPQYQKPTVRKDLKELQINPYYTLVEDSEYKGFKLYRNVLLGGTVNYAVSLKGSVMFLPSSDEMRESIDLYLK